MALKDPLELVMVVDDDATDNFIAKRIIEITGFARNAIVTSSTTEALGYLTAHQQYPEKLPAIIFLDINMPLQDGFDFLEKFSALSAEITTTCKVIILSSSANKKDIKRIFRNDHVIKFITKPISEDALEEIRFIKPIKS